MRLAVVGTAVIRDKGSFIACPFFLAFYYSVIVLVARIEQSSAFSPPLSLLSFTTTTTTTHLYAVVPSILSVSDKDEEEKVNVNIDVISTNNDSCNHNDLNHHHHHQKKYDGPYHRLSRRDIFELSTQTISFALPTAALMSMSVVLPARAVAAESTAKAEIDTNSYEILRQLRSVPTFCIVTNDGIPFMVLDKTTTKNQIQQTASGYFFLSYQTASENLRSARQKEEGQNNVWSNAKIIIVPLGVALQLSLSENQQREVVNYNNNSDVDGNGVVIGPPLLLSTHHDIIVSSKGTDDANEVDSRVEADRGNNNNNTPNNKDNTNTNTAFALKERVPLFYMDGLKLANGKEPRYFNELDLWQEWDRQNPSQSPPPSDINNPSLPQQQRPPTKLVELLELYGTALNLDDSNSNNNNNNNAALEMVANLTLMPVVETVQVGKELLKTSIPPNYNFKQMYLMGGPPSTATSTTNNNN
eukprot:CAMPEP_0194399088 /NCGR_PEP_ID=MMETSP0174-20130528/126467_1 /TAXON_ID=216777 /ORGANISM="Proboscia alata, Strain PI-D3" /LENGTH=471 /DNA_ID=CAMNT_0039195461 /DNA_START=251 /DNA_END=1666 /DNA_ORIENTATION=-